MNNYKRLFSNSIIFAIGNLGSKLIIIFLVPFYTYFLSTQEYGIVDLLTTTINMLLPIVSLSIFEAVLRFTMDKDSNSRQVLTNGMVVTTLGVILSLLFYPLISKFVGNVVYLYLILSLQSYQSLLSQYTRAIGKVKVFAVNGILTAIVLSISNVFFIAFLGYGIQGYLLSMAFSSLVSIVYLSLKSKIFTNLEFSAINLDLMKKMIRYCLPLIPNSFMWWIINASNRYFVVYFLGLGINGLFSVSNKIPSVLAIFQMIFFQAWQLSAIDEFGSSNQEKFYSKVFNFFSSWMILVTSIILLFLKPIISFLLSADFYDSWQYVPFLLFGTLFSSYSSFFGINYVAAKKTSGVLISSILGSIVNIAICLTLIPVIGANGASVATMFSFFVIWIYRIVDTRKIIKIKIPYRKLFIELTLLFIQTIFLYFYDVFIINAAILGLLLVINLKMIVQEYLNYKENSKES